MVHTLCLDNVQTFSFQPNGDFSWDPAREAHAHVCVTRRAVVPTRSSHTGQLHLELTGCWVMPREEARQLWRSLIKDGAFRVAAVMSSAITS